MSDNHYPAISDQWIVSLRGSKNSVDKRKPYAWLTEKERTVDGKIEDTAIIFLTNSECPFHCLMCDLWKNTTDFPSPAGAIPEQIAWALERLPETKHLKLYNSGSFFDERAIPESDYKRIASIINHFETVIVESHPRLINEKCLRFSDMLKPELQVAMGLETVNPEIFSLLNKKMALADFRESVRYLKEHHILSRAFILLKPPFHSESEGIYWAQRSIDFAFDCEAECCTIIPVMGGNGAMELLNEQGFFSPPAISSLEDVLEYGISLRKGRVFADTWDLGLFSSCEKCLGERNERLKFMNLNQEIVKKIECTCNI
jgi:radical SAM enzyme (TIGR01210 family)